MDVIDIREFESFILKRFCAKCRHGWFPRSGNNPQRCPRCQTWLDRQVENEEIPKSEELNAPITRQ